MRLQVGLVGKQPGYKIILEQEGVSYSSIPITNITEIDNYPVIVLNNSFSKVITSRLYNYIKNGGCILTSANFFSELFDCCLATKKKKYILPQKKSLFSEVGLVDLYDKIKFPNSIQVKALDTGLKIFLKKYGKGKILILPFAVNKLILNSKSKRKKFYHRRKELPSEIVARVSKNKIRRIVKKSLEYLFHQQKLPFITKWYYPKKHRQAFLFRVDTDFCSTQDAYSLYEICQKYNINSTWFVDTASNEKLEETYSKFNAEIALHCNVHKVYNNFKDNFEHLQTAISELNKVEIDTKGFAAPFGEWNLSLAQALEKFNFAYSSEFTFDYDDFPFHPYLNNRASSVMQIPIHPISLGRLRRSHYSKEEMFAYYKMIVAEKRKISEPIIFYHHPHHKHFSVFEKLFKHIRNMDFWNPSFIEFSRWWNIRKNIKFNPTYKNDTIVLDEIATDYAIRISTTREKFKILPAQKRIDLNKIEFDIKKISNYSSDVKRMRNFHWRDLLYNFETWRAKQNV